MAAEMAAALRGALSACLLLCGESGGLRLSRGVDGAAVSDGDLGSSPPRTFNGGGPAKRRPGSAGGRGGRRLGLCAPHDPALPGYLGALCVFTRCAAAGVAPVCSEQWSAPLGRVCLGQVCCRSGAKSLLL